MARNSVQAQPRQYQAADSTSTQPKQFKANITTEAARKREGPIERGVRVTFDGGFRGCSVGVGVGGVEARKAPGPASSEPKRDPITGLEP